MNSCSHKRIPCSPFIGDTGKVLMKLLLKQFGAWWQVSDLFCCLTAWRCCFLRGENVTVIRLISLLLTANIKMHAGISSHPLWGKGRAMASSHLKKLILLHYKKKTQSRQQKKTKWLFNKTKCCFSFMAWVFLALPWLPCRLIHP